METRRELSSKESCSFTASSHSVRINSESHREPVLPHARAAHSCVLCVFRSAPAIICDRYLVVSLETLCVRWNIREDVAGCFFMAFGSAAPEVLVSCIGTAKGAGNTDLGVGAIIGSGMIVRATHNTRARRPPRAQQLTDARLSLAMLLLSELRLSL